MEQKFIEVFDTCFKFKVFELFVNPNLIKTIGTHSSNLKEYKEQIRNIHNLKSSNKHINKILDIFILNNGIYLWSNVKNMNPNKRKLVKNIHFDENYNNFDNIDQTFPRLKKLSFNLLFNELPTKNI